MATNAVTIAALLAKEADVHPRVVGQPTDDDIYKIEEVLGPILHNAKYDMIVVPGVVSHNLVGLFQPIATYVDTWNAAFIIPTEPAPYDTTINDNATSVVRNQMEAKHNNLLSDYKVFEAAEKGASDFICAVVNETWYKSLRHPVTFYNNVTAITLIKYLRTNSGGLHSNNLATLPSEMLHYYAEAEGIPEFILALAKAREKLTRGGLPMSDAKVLATAHSQVFASPHYPEATREWERLPPAQQTAWQAKYREANIERLRLQRANPNSFGSAHHVTDTHFDHEQITNALDNIANVATNDSNVMASILEQLAALRKQLDNLQTTAPSRKKEKEKGGTPASTAFTPRTYSKEDALATFNLTGYCSTHGYRVHASHTSKTCKKKGKTHNDEATRENTMGGSTKNKGWEN